MPVNVFDEKRNETIDFLFEDDWGLPSQIYEFEEWLTENIGKFRNGNYCADIGYVKNEEAGGGGGVVTLKLMKMLTSIGMEIWLSEYPSDELNKE